MPQIATRQPAPTPVTDTIALPPKVPPLPEDVFERFPSLRLWQEQEDRWWNRAYQALQETNRWVSQTVSADQTGLRNLRVSFNQFTAQIEEELDVISDELGAQAKLIVTVSAMAGVLSNIKVQATPPVGPSAGDYWIDTSDPAEPTTYQWNGVDWVQVTQPIAFAGVADERTARVTADGFLSGKYTLSVIAGDVITGVNITSASGPGTNVSNVAWTADQFQIYSGATKKTMFVADALQDKVRLNGVFTVDGSSNSIYIKTTAGAGTYNSAGTPFYVDNLGRMSLGNRLTFDGTNLTIAGAITASSGFIGGWQINPTTISRNNAVLDSAGQLILGTANDVVYLSSIDATYRIWIGNVTAGSAAFRVEKNGTMHAVDGTFSGTISSASGTIGGFTIGATSLSAGASASFISINSDATAGIVMGDATGSQLKLFTTVGSSLLSIYDVNNELAVELSSGGVAGRLRLFLSATETLAFGASTGITFQSDTNLYRASANVLATDDSFRVGSQFQASNGSAGSPSITFSGDPDTGLFTTGPGRIEFATNGTARMVLRDGALALIVPLKLDNNFVAGAPAATGYVTVQDLAGATYRLLCAP